MTVTTCSVCRAEFRQGASACPRCGHRIPGRRAINVVRVLAGAAIVIGVHWFFASGTLRQQVTSLAIFSAGLAALVATISRE